MAVPFVVPEEQNEVEVIIIQLQSLLTKLQAAVRRSRGTPRTSPEVRNRTSASGSSQTQTQDQGPSTSGPSTSGPSTSGPSTSGPSTSSAVPTANIPELLNNLAWLTIVSQEVAPLSHQLSTSATFTSTRRRTTSESSCCEESKMSITTVNRHGVQDWNQMNGADISSAKTNSSQGIFSKFIQGRVSAPLWTAMICFVGWHLFGTR